jgi:hypothetical protein
MKYIVKLLNINILSNNYNLILENKLFFKNLIFLILLDFKHILTISTLILIKLSKFIEITLTDIN